MQLFGCGVLIIALMLARFQAVRLLNLMLLIIFCSLMYMCYNLEYNMQQDKEDWTHYSATLAAMQTYTFTVLLCNIDFILTQYVYSIICLGFSIIANHIIYGIGTLAYNEKVFFTIIFVFFVSIGNYNLNKSIVLQTL